MKREEAQKWHRETGAPIKCIQEALPFHEIWVRTNGAGEIICSDLNDKERKILDWPPLPEDIFRGGYDS
jgi:hypothetical protein